MCFLLLIVRSLLGMRVCMGGEGDVEAGAGGSVERGSRLRESWGAFDAEEQRRDVKGGWQRWGVRVAAKRHESTEHGNTLLCCAVLCSPSALTERERSDAQTHTPIAAVAASERLPSRHSVLDHVFLSHLVLYHVLRKSTDTSMRGHIAQQSVCVQGAEVHKGEGVCQGHVPLLESLSCCSGFLCCASFFYLSSARAMTPIHPLPPQRVSPLAPSVFIIQYRRKARVRRAGAETRDGREAESNVVVVVVVGWESEEKRDEKADTQQRRHRHRHTCAEDTVRCQSTTKGQSEGSVRGCVNVCVCVCGGGAPAEQR